MHRYGVEPGKPLRVGFVGSGFIAHFHLRSLLGVRNVVITGVYSPTASNRESFAQAVRDQDLGPCRAHASLDALLSADDVDAVWILTPNHTRLEVMRALNAAVISGRSKIFAVACEKPLGRTLAEAREMLELAQSANLNHGYLENQVFSSAVERGKEVIWRRAVPQAGRPYLARASEEHSGPHAPWFWRGDLQGGGVLSDMLCHSVEVARYLLTSPGGARSELTLKSANGSVANLKWTRQRYAAELAARMGKNIDYRRRASEDFARGYVTMEDPEGNEVVIEATTSWSYVGAGLRINLEMLGPEYSLEFSSSNTPLRIFMSRAIQGDSGEDMLEKQNAEQGLMPVLDDEPGIYGYTGENRHMVECFRGGRTPIETFEDGVAVVELLMALYYSAEHGQVVRADTVDLSNFVPAVARSPAE